MPLAHYIDDAEALATCVFTQGAYARSLLLFIATPIFFASRRGIFITGRLIGFGI